MEGQEPITFSDYNIDNPSGGPASVGDSGTLEFLLELHPELTSERRPVIRLTACPGDVYVETHGASPFPVQDLFVSRVARGGSGSVAPDPGSACPVCVRCLGVCAWVRPLLAVLTWTDRPRVDGLETARATMPTHTVVALGGELDAAALSSLVESFDDAIEQDDSDVVIDLAGVDFIGAAWIGTFVRSRGVPRNAGPRPDTAGAVARRQPLARPVRAHVSGRAAHSAPSSAGLHARS